MAGEVTDDPATSSRSRRRADRRPAEPLPLPVAVDSDESGVRRLYTAAMMADVLGVPPAAVRHWVRGRLLEPARRAGSLEWFDFSQLVVGRHLARLLAAGGQLQLPFYTAALADPPAAASRLVGDGVVGLPLPATVAPGRADDEGRTIGDDIAEILDLADDLEAAGEFVEAAEALRAALQAQGPTAHVNFMLAELLYRAGDLTAARERYYAAIEIDAEHLRARASLGCVLAELGDHELALAALEGVLRQEPDYADAHWHVAGVLGEMGRPREACHHLARFLALAPESPWAVIARERLDALR